MKMLIEIDKIEHVEKWIRTKFDARPEAEYIGNYCGIGECKYTPLDKRK